MYASSYHSFNTAKTVIKDNIIVDDIYHTALRNRSQITTSLFLGGCSLHAGQIKKKCCFLFLLKWN